MKNKGLLKTIIITGLIAGVLDLSGAIINYMLSHKGTFPKKILEYIAGGVYGGSALDGSLKMNIMGGIFHFSLAMIWTIIFFVSYPKVKLFHKNIWLTAFLYGLVVWAVMNLVVLPLSAWKAPISPFSVTTASRAAFILMLCIALPNAISARRYYSNSTS